jgi:hypothetical protein
MENKVLTKDQQKGLDIMVKVLNKQYPYIIGVSPNIGDFERYSTLFTLKIIISAQKLEKYFKQKVDYRWTEFWRFSNIFNSNPDPEGLIIKDIKNLGVMFYKSIGNEYHFETGSLVRKNNREVQINSFILDDKN